MKLFQRIVTGIFCVFVALPILWLLYAAFLPPDAVLSARLLPTGFSLANFRELWGTGIFRALGISLLASGLTVLGQLTIGICTAYAMRTGVRLLPIILMVLALPSELLLIPLYRELQILNLLETFWVLFLPFLASPLVIFLLFQAMKRLEWDMVEAASIDGAGHPTIVTRLIVPLMPPQEF